MTWLSEYGRSLRAPTLMYLTLYLCIFVAVIIIGVSACKIWVVYLFNACFFLSFERFMVLKLYDLRTVNNNDISLE